MKHPIDSRNAEPRLLLRLDVFVCAVWHWARQTLGWTICCGGFLALIARVAAATGIA
ncbi:MAG: hypothetical protein M0P19_10245 [Nevskia sp.]|jgi:hypothetical protein|nr:hypothetical protein [Nevskia sp.]MCK9385041.1 hypothetical protein [Nevskia sp.]